MTIQEEKAALRKLIRAGRRQLPPGLTQNAGLAAAQHLFASFLWKQDVILAYAAIRGEMDMTPILEAALAAGKTLLMPRCCGSRLALCHVTDLRSLVPMTLGIPEPDDSCPEILSCPPGLALIPGLSFDRKGIRLGQGGGYYDRFLPDTPLIRVGVCYASELRDQVPCEPFDSAMDYLLTEDALLRVKGEDRRDTRICKINS